MITGAAGGIGAASTALFRAEGATVVGVDLRDDIPGVDLALAADVASEDAVIELFHRARSEGVRVNALCPGPVDTPLLRELFASDPAQAARQLIHLPMGRFATAGEVAAAALFLASDESSYVTASAFMVDGGISGAVAHGRGAIVDGAGARSA